MISFDKKEFIAASEFNLGLKDEVNKAIDKMCKQKYSNLFLVGIGGSYADMKQMNSILKSYSTIDAYVEIAPELYTKGNKNLNKDSIVIVTSASGNTMEIKKVLDYVKEFGARTIAFVANPESEIGKKADIEIVYKNPDAICLEFTVMTLYLALFRFMYNNGDFPKYDQFMEQLTKLLPEGLCKVREDFDKVAEEYVTKYKDETEFTLIGTGTLWAGVYYFSMCILQEMQWLKSRHVHGAEFFHGALEIVDRNTKLMLFKGEDATRPLMDRVQNFANKVTKHVQVFDTKDYRIPGISEEFCDIVSYLIYLAMMERLSKHFEDKRKHNLDIRRYYKVMDY